MPTTEFAVAASDGLWDVMDPQAVVEFVRRRIATKVDLQMIARELVNKALSGGSVDNVTAVIMLFHLHKLTPHDRSASTAP
jgi:serine/threonine protein phosphatase PrpC